MWLPRVIPRARLRLVLLILGCTWGARALALDARSSDPEYLISGWQTDQGLPESTVTAIAQAPDGYLWIGTFNGLVRFDGVQFTTFDRANTPELPSPEIVNLHFDRSGRLWLSTTQGMACVKDGKWQVFQHGKGWIGNFVRWFAESAAGELFLTTFDGKLLRFRGNGFEELPPPPGDPARGVYPYVDSTGALWVVTPEFIGRFVASHWESMIPIATWTHETLLGAAPSRDGELWILTNERLRKYRGNRLTFETPGSHETDGAWQIFEDSTGAVWVGSQNTGLHRFTRETGWRRFTTRDGLAYDTIRSVFEDHEANLWIGTGGGGLQRFRRRIFSSWGLEQGLPERVVKSVAVDEQGRVFIGTHGQGVARLDETGIRALWRPEPTGDRPAHVNSVLVDRRDRLWVGSYKDGLHRVDGKDHQRFSAGQDGRVRPFRKGDDAFFVSSLFEDSQGRIWIGAERGVSRFDGTDFRTYPLEAATPLDTVRCFAEDPRNGAIWAGHHAKGLYRLQGDRFEPVKEAEELAHDAISALQFDADGTLWIGTQDRGLACLRNSRLVRITESQGLPAGGIAAIVDDGLGSLWIGSNRGVLRARRQDLEAVVSGRKLGLDVQAFDQNDGLPAVECSMSSQPAAAKDREGRIWFATTRGVAMVDPKSLRPNAMLPPVVIQEVWIDGRLAGGGEPFRTSQASAPAPVLSVPAGAKRIEIHYAALSYSVPEKVRFRYLLEGLDKEWIDVGSRRVAYLQDLKPGEYRFRVKAANNDGVWNEAGAVVAFSVKPFVWQTLWFRLLVLCALVGVTALAASRVAHGRLQRRIERLEQARALEQEKARLASVLETTSDFVGFADLQGNVLYLNPAGRRMLGLSETADLHGRKLADFHPAWATERISDGILAAIRDGTWSSETALLHPDGREIPLSQVIVAHQSSEGNVDFVSTIARDISERKQAELELARQHAALAVLYSKEQASRKLAERLQASAQVVNESLDLDVVLPAILDQLHEVIAYDSATIQLLEAEAMRVIAARGMPAAELGRIRPLAGYPYNRRLASDPEPIVIPHAQSDALWWGDLAKLDANLSSIRSNLGVPLIVRDRIIGALTVDSHEPGRYTAQDAQTALAFARQAAIAIENARLYTSAQCEIAERRRAEEGLRESEERYRELFENANDAVYTLDLEGDYLTLNRAFERITGYTRAELLGQSCLSLVPPEYQALARRMIRRKVVEGRPTTFELEISTKDGRRVPIEVSSRVIYEDARPYQIQAIARDITERKSAEANARRLIGEEAARQQAEAARGQITEANEKLKTWVGQLELRNREMARLGEMIGLLQTCGTGGELGDVVTHMLPELFEGEAGALYLFEQGRNLLVTAAAWGSSPPRADSFLPDECWALRLGRPHVVEGSSGGLRCPHSRESGSAYACLPLIAQGEALGILHVRCADRQPEEGRRAFLQTVGENLALGLANVRLREALRQQAIRDPLTGLYNRRSMEEALERELRLAGRRVSPLAVVMADIDHFKRLNDRYGHDAGDAVLREVAGLINGRIRSSDLACRYGGEELLLILPDTRLDEAARLAEGLRECVQGVAIQSHGRAIGRVTMSLGVAAFPTHGATTAALLRAADAALYQAKGQGRDRVMTSGAC